MQNLKINEYQGRVSKCPCTNPHPVMNCPRCFCRGYLAECLSCTGTGQKSAEVPGGAGVMKSTCPQCGGTGSFGVKKPDDFEAREAGLAGVEESSGSGSERWGASDWTSMGMDKDNFPVPKGSPEDVT